MHRRSPIAIFVVLPLPAHNCPIGDLAADAGPGDNSPDPTPEHPRARSAGDRFTSAYKKS
jgi:hypothetical protein